MPKYIKDASGRVHTYTDEQWAQLGSNENSTLGKLNPELNQWQYSNAEDGSGLYGTLFDRPNTPEELGYLDNPQWWANNKDIYDRGLQYVTGQGKTLDDYLRASAAGFQRHANAAGGAYTPGSSWHRVLNDLIYPEMGLAPQQGLDQLPGWSDAAASQRNQASRALDKNEVVMGLDMGDLAKIAGMAGAAWGGGQLLGGMNNLSSPEWLNSLLAETGEAGVGAGALEGGFNAAAGAGATALPVSAATTSADLGATALSDTAATQGLEFPSFGDVGDFSGFNPDVSGLEGVLGEGVLTPGGSASTGFQLQNLWGQLPPQLQNVLKNNVPGLAQMTAGLTQDTASTTGGGKGAYQFPFGNVIGGLLEYANRKEYQDKLLGLMDKSIERSDPFYSQRPQYQQQLSQMYSDPNYFNNNAVFKGLNDNALRQTAAQQSAKGYNMSGNMLQELQKTATNESYKYALPFMDQTATYAGAKQGPGYAGYMTGQLGGQAAQAGLGANGALGSVFGSVMSGTQPTGPQQAAGVNSNQSLIDVFKGMVGGNSL